MTKERFFPLSGCSPVKVVKTVEAAAKSGFITAEIGTLDNSIPVLVNLEDRICIPVPLVKK